MQQANTSYQAHSLSSNLEQGQLFSYKSPEDCAWVLFTLHYIQENLFHPTLGCECLHTPKMNTCMLAYSATHCF